MALNSSGQISMGGSTSGESINLELGRPATQAINLNESEVRSLAGVPTGAISLNNFYGKSSAQEWIQTNSQSPMTSGAATSRNVGWIRSSPGSTGIGSVSPTTRYSHPILGELFCVFHNETTTAPLSQHSFQLRFSAPTATPASPAPFTFSLPDGKKSVGHPLLLGSTVPTPLQPVSPLGPFPYTAFTTAAPPTSPVTFLEITWNLGPVLPTLGPVGPRNLDINNPLVTPSGPPSFIAFKGYFVTFRFSPTAYGPAGGTGPMDSTLLGSGAANPGTPQGYPSLPTPLTGQDVPWTIS
jgi:hypothetical protein